MISPPAQVRTLLIDDHTLFRECVARVLSMEADFTVEHCGSISASLRILTHSRFDVVLLDQDLGPERASQFLPAARQTGFDGRVLIVTAWISDTEIRRLLRQGVSGVFFKERPLSELAESVRAVTTGQISLDPRYQSMSTFGRPSAGDSSRHFNDRQRRVLHLVTEGLSNKEIGFRLKISESYVKTLLQRLFQKTGVRTRGQLVRIALEQYREQLLEEPAEVATGESTVSHG